MLKKLLLVVTICLVLCSCTNNTETTTVSYNTVPSENQIAETIIPPSTNHSHVTVTEATTVSVPFYEVNPLENDISLMDSIEDIGEILGIDIESNCPSGSVESGYSFDQNGQHIVYIFDFSVFLEDMTETDPISGVQGYYPFDYEYHILKRLKIDGICINEYESESWAECGFRAFVDQAISLDIELDDSSSQDGYCFTILTEESGLKTFRVVYWVGRYTISYSYSINRADTDNYNNYLDYCELLELPTSDQMTSEIND
jgi:hypothetical protein